MHQKIKLKDYQKFFIFKLRPKDYLQEIEFIEKYVRIKKT